ncbi:MAG: DUF805 domain-containing protein [Rhodoglobus sp.]
MTNSPSAMPLSQPLYGASFGQAVSRFFTKYATFSGRASRSEYWWLALFFLLVYIALGAVIGGTIAATPTTDQYGQTQLSGAAIAVIAIGSAAFLGLVIPNLAVSVRRLHDANFSGWLYLLHLVPSVGSIIVFVLTLMPSSPEGRRYDA